MYAVPSRQWVRISRMNFKGPSAKWIESVPEPDKIPWPNFCKLLHERFARDQRDRLVRQMFHITQTTTVTDYIDRFSTLFDQLKAYQPNPDMHYYTTRFLDGLREDIRSVVTVHRPTSLDTAFSLALLQDEVGMAIPKPDGNKHGFRQFNKPPMVEKNPGVVAPGNC